MLGRPVHSRQLGAAQHSHTICMSEDIGSLEIGNLPCKEGLSRIPSKKRESELEIIYLKK